MEFEKLGTYKECPVEIQVLFSEDNFNFLQHFFKNIGILKSKFKRVVL